MRLIPVTNHVLLKRAEPPETTTGGIIIPGNVREQTDLFEIVDHGPDAHVDFYTNNELPRPVTVTIQPYAGVEVRFEGTKYVVVKDQDIILVLGERKNPKPAAPVRPRLRPHSRDSIG